MRSCTWPRRWPRSPRGSRRFGSTTRRAPTSSGWRRSRRPRRRSATRRHRRRSRPPPRPPTTTSSSASRVTRRCCGRRSRRRSSRAATASTSSRRKPRPPSTCARFPTRTSTAFLAEMRKVINDPAVEVAWAARDVRPPPALRGLDSEAFKAIEANVTKHYKTVTLPTMSTGATDMAYLRAKGMQCYGDRAGDRRRGRSEGVRRAQRSGADSRKRALPLRAVPLRHRRRSGPRALAPPHHIS